MTWKPINSAPKHEDRRQDGFTWGPMIWLRAGDHSAKGRWRHDRKGPDPNFNQTMIRAGGWRDERGGALTFAPTEWREIDG